MSLVDSPAAARCRAVLAQSLYRNAALLMVNYGLVAGCGFLFWLVAARLYPAETVGGVNAMVAALTLLGTITALGIPNAVIRFLPAERRPRRALGRAWALVGAVSLAAGIVIVAVPNHLGVPLALTGLPPGPSTLLFPAVLATFTVGMLSDAALIAQRRADGIVIKNGVASLARILALPLLALLGAAGLVSAFTLGVVLASTLSVLLAVRRTRDAAPVDPPASGGVSRRRFVASNYASALISSLPTTVLPLLVLHAHGPAAAAYVGVPLLVVSALNAVPSTVSQSLFAELSATRTDLRAATVGALRWSYAFLVPAVAGAVLLATWGLGLFGEAYAREGATCLRWMALSTLVATLNYVADVVLNATGRVGRYAVVNVTGTLCVLAALVLALPHGLAAVGLAWLLGNLGYCVIALLALRGRGAARPPVRVEQDRARC